MIEIHEITTKKEIANLKSALTFVGLSISADSLNDMFDWINQYTEVLNRQIYVIKGNVMNFLYKIPKSKQFADDLNIVCVDLKDLRHPDKLILKRFEVGGLWLDDIVEGISR